MMNRTMRVALVVLSLAVACHVSSAAEPGAATTAPAAPQLLSVERIWDKGQHNAFTSLIRFKDRWICAFREAAAHKGGTRGSVIRVIVSDDAKAWESVTTLADPRGDIRDAKLAILPDGRLMLLTATQLFEPQGGAHQSIVFTTSDLKTWDGPHDVADRGMWLWGIRFHDGVGYSIGYSTGKEHFCRLYRTTDGLKFQAVVDRFDVAAPYPNESAMWFDDDGTARVLLRCDPDAAYLGTAAAPYEKWDWRQTNARVGGPALTRTPDGRLLGAGRLHDGKVRTALFWIDEKTAAITECLTLPSGGDTSYPGLVWSDGGVLNMSYYSSHEDNKACIYFARVKFPAK